MRLFIIVPMFTASEEEVSARSAAWTDWYKDQEVGVNGGWERLRTRYGLDQTDALPLLPGRTIVVRPSEPDPVKITLPSFSETRVGKGLAVRLALLTALDQADREGISARSNAKCVLIDGSGAFDFDNIFKIADLLYGKGDESPAPIVFGRRPEDDYGMSDDRKAIEDFEHFALLRGLELSETRYDGVDGLPPDGQAGCWGVSLLSLAQLALSAPGYEIEIDLFSSAMKSGIVPAFSRPLQMRPRGSSGFGKSVIPESMQKIGFLEQKIRSNPKRTHEAWQAFKTAYPGIFARIPEPYGRAIENRASPMVRATLRAVDSGDSPRPALG